MFIYNLGDIAKKLKIDFDGITKQIEHNGVKGSAREDLLKDYLKKLLPQKYSISSGIIIDNNQTQSKQQDFIIHDAFNCPSFFKTDSNSILPIESVYATIEIKSTLDYPALEQSVKNIESVRKLNKLPNRNIIGNLYDNVYPLGFVFAYSSNYSLEQIQKKLFELNKSIEGKHQISIICILDKGLIFNVQKNNVTNVTLIPSNETLLARSDSNIENTLYSFYLFLLEYLDNVHIQVPSLIEYARKNNAFKVSINIPNELIPDDAIYKEGLIELRYEDARKMLSLNNKYPNLFNGKMTYEEMFQYLKDDFIPLSKLQAKMAKVKSHNKIVIYGYEFLPSDFIKFEEYALNYNINEDAKNNFDKIVNDIYLKYKIEVEEKNKMNKIYIVHCWDGTKDDGWYPWLDKKISNSDNEIIRFNMPNTANPKIEEWISELDKQVKQLDKHTYFVGHSIGCQTIMRYLEKQNVKKIGGILFVALWLDLLPDAVSDEESYNTAQPWLNTPIDFEKVKSMTDKITCIFSDNDYFVSLEQEKRFKELFNAKTIVVREKGHISAEDGVKELEDIYNALVEIIK